MQCDDPPGCEAYPPGLFPDFDCRRAASEAWEGQIDWDSWRRVFEERPPAAWGDGDGAAYFGAYMDSDDWAMERHWAECPLGALNAAMYLYSASVLQGDPSSAARYAADVARGLRSFPLRILLGSSWPLFALLSGDRLRELRPDVSGDPGRNCGGVEKPALRWGQFQAAFYGEERKEWSANTMRYVLSWQMSYIPELLEEECPLGVLTLNTIQAFTCATSESSCFRAFIQKVEAWIAASPDFVDVLAHSRWPISLVLNHMSHSTRHRYQLDFSEEELVGGWRTLALLPPSGLPAPALSGAARRASSAEARFPAHLGALGRWAALLSSGGGRSRAFRDALGALPHLGPGHPEAPSLVYISMVYGPRFSRHIGRFCARARALGAPGERLLLFALDGEAHRECLRENGQRCLRGTPSIVNKFTMPLVLAHLGLDSVWIDFDTFLMKDPTPIILEHARRGSYDILVSGSFESDCICNGVVFFRSSDMVRTWLLSVVLWMYHHPYEHDQKTFSAFLNYTESVQLQDFDLPPIPPWDTLDPISQFVTPDVFEGNGWTGDLDQIAIYHFLNGESDTGSGLDPSGAWSREHGHFQEGAGAPPRCRDAGDPLCGGGKVSLMDLFYLQDDEDLYSTPKPAHENAAIRRALLAARKEVRRLDLLGKPCGPMVGLLSQPTALPLPPGSPSPAELLQLAREGGRPPWHRAVADAP